MLGIPFNIASYSLLTCLIAHICGYIPHKMIHVIGDAHIYMNHIESAREQLTRIPMTEPRIVFNRHLDNIEDFRYEDVELLDYFPHDPIRFKLAV